MALRHDYTGQACSMARALEVIGERWTLLIVRDLFWGVRRFGEFASHLGIPRAVLAERLKSLTAAGLIERVPGVRGRDEYELTEKGLALWPAVRMLIAWGDEYYAPRGTRRVFEHAQDGGIVDAACKCSVCDGAVDVHDTVMVPGPGLEDPSPGDDPVSRMLAERKPLLRPLRAEPVGPDEPSEYKAPAAR